MKSLQEKYGNFSAPCYSIKINGNEVNAKYCKGELQIELTAGYDASSCTFQIANAFSVEKDMTIALKDDLQKLMKLGNQVEVLVGYRQGGMESVFRGYIDVLYLDYDKEDGPFYIAECLDGKGIMMNSFRSECKNSIKKYSAAVESTIKKYSSIIKIKSTDLDHSDEEVTVPIEQHRESDYDFVVRLGKKLNYCFYIEKGNLVFKPYTKLSKEKYFSFHLNEYLLSFKMAANLKDQVSAVKVRGNNEKDPTKPFEAQAVQYSSLTDSSMVKTIPAKIISSHVSQTIIDLTIDSTEQAKRLAEAKLGNLTRDLYHGKIKTLGVPQMLPGKIAVVKGFGKDFDRSYFIARVIHKIKNDRFTTECELEANKV